MPAPDGTLSVFRTSELGSDAVWHLADVHITPSTSKPVLARGDFQAGFVYGTKQLGLEADDNPPGHANICRWPSEKPKQKQLAMRLAAEAKLVVR